MRRPDAKPRTRREPRPLPAPDEAGLQSAALTYLARYAATQAGLARVLQRRVDRWARQQAGEMDQVSATVGRARVLIASLVQRLAASGAVDDAAFAQSRARSLARAGRSRRAIGAHLAGKGVPGQIAAEMSVRNATQDLAAALIHCRKRRLGPWRKVDITPELRRKELANLARAGYAQAVASAALRLTQDDAEQRIIDFRSVL